MVRSATDPFFPVGNAKALAGEIPGATLLVLDGVGPELPSRAHAEVATAGPDGRIPNGSMTNSTSPAESGSSSPPVQTSAVMPRGRPPLAATQSGPGSHTLSVATRARLLRGG